MSILTLVNSCSWNSTGRLVHTTGLTEFASSPVPTPAPYASKANTNQKEALMPKIVRTIASLFIVKLMLITIGLTVLASIDDAEARRVRVRGYFRKDGTYVRPHYRTAPDGNPYNNYSFPGNCNPNTGKYSTGNPSTYLKRYYSRTTRSTSSWYTSPTFPTYVPRVRTDTQPRVSYPSVWSTPNYNFNYGNSLYGTSSWWNW